MSWSDMPTVHEDPLYCDTCRRVTEWRRVIYSDVEYRTCSRCGRKEKWVKVAVETGGKTWVLDEGREDTEKRQRDDTDDRRSQGFKSSKLTGIFRRKRRKGK